MRREWTESEERALRNRYQYQTVQKTAQMLNRSIYSVKRKATKMGLSHYNDKLSAKTVAQSFNTEARSIKRWIEKFGLPSKKVNHGTHYTYYIDAEDFWKWAEEHKDIINWSKYESRSLVPEPKWVGEIVSNYTTVRHGQKFTPDELARIKFLICRGKTYSEIAKEMQRSYYSISHVGRKIFM